VPLSDTLVDVSVPYLAEFVRQGRRKVENGIFWEKGTVAIRTVTAEQAPISCRVSPGVNSSRPEFSVRSFDGRFWWPLFDGDAPMLARKYVASALKSSSVFLSMMNLSPATVDSPRRDVRKYLEDVFPRKFDGCLRKDRWRSADSIANRTLFCDDQVYLQGGSPIYFAVPRGAPDDRMLALEVGSAEPERVEIVSRYLPGPRPSQRRDAACRSLVYGVESIAEDIDAIRGRGFRVAFGSKAEEYGQLRSSREASEICADGVVRRAVTAMDRHTYDQLGALLHGRLQPAALLPPKLTLALCRDAIDAMITMCPEQEFPRRFRVEFEWAAEALLRLDATLPPIDLNDLDDHILLALSNSCVPVQLTAG
jgi:hypothetical protein